MKATPGVGSFALNIVTGVEQAWALRISDDARSYEGRRLPAQECSLQELVQKQLVADDSEPGCIGLHGLIAKGNAVPVYEMSGVTDTVTWGRRSHRGKEIVHHVIMPDLHAYSQPEVFQNQIQMSEQDPLSHQ